MQELHETALKSLALDDVSGKIPLHIPNPHGYAVIGLAADIDHMMDVMALTARHHVPVVMIAGDLHKDAAATLTDILARHPSPQGRIQIVCLNWGDSALPQPE